MVASSFIMVYVPSVSTLIAERAEEIAEALPLILQTPPSLNSRATTPVESFHEPRIFFSGVKAQAAKQQTTTASASTMAVIFFNISITSVC